MPRLLTGLVIANLLTACVNEPAARDVAIPAVQGAGSASPYAGSRVSVTGVVTGDFQDGDANDPLNLGGFYLQDPDGDGDDATSDGIFVYGRGQRIADVEPGDVVRVSGRVQEHYGETQIVADSVSVSGRGSIEAVDVILPAAGVVTNSDGDAIADLERFEGMYVRFPQRLVATDLYELNRYGALRAAAGERLYQFTNSHRPDAHGYRAHVIETAARTLVLDDGRRDARAGPPDWYFTDGPLRAGDAIVGASGNLRYSRGSGGDGREDWRLMPSASPAIERSNPRPAAPRPGGSLVIATANLWNAFFGIDDGRPVCGPRRDSGCRGADSAAERRRQFAKLATALALMEADVLALVELENNPRTAIAALTDAVNERPGRKSYAWIDTGIVGDDTIRGALLYDADRVQPLGRPAILDDSVDPRFNDNRNRPAIAQAFRTRDNGAVLTVVVNHFKSKGSPCDADGDPNTGDGQGNCAKARTGAALALAEWLAGDPTGSGDPDILITGDLNAYLEEDPIVALEAAGFVNLLDREATTAYTYLHRGQAGALDHALASPTLAKQVAGVVAWHVNADEPAFLDYNLEGRRDPALFDAETPFRFSDHDPVVVGFDLD